MFKTILFGVLDVLALIFLSMVAIICVGLFILVFSMVIDAITGHDLIRELIHPLFK